MRLLQLLFLIKKVRYKFQFTIKNSRKEKMASVAKVKQDIKRMDNIITNLKTLSKDIGSFNDGVHLRDQIQNNVKELMDTCKDVKTNITILRNNNDPEIDSVENSFEQVSQTMKQELPQILNGLKQSSSSQAGQSDSRPDVMNQSLLMDQQLVDQDSDQLILLENEVNQILSIMREVKALFDRTMQEIQSQRNMIIGIDRSTSKAAEDMTMGSLELEKAQNHQKSSRKCLCWILLIILVVVICVVVFVVVLVLKNKKKTDDSGESGDETPAALRALFHF